MHMEKYNFELDVELLCFLQYLQLYVLPRSFYSVSRRGIHPETA